MLTVNYPISNKAAINASGMLFNFPLMIQPADSSGYWTRSQPTISSDPSETIRKLSVDGGSFVNTTNQPIYSTIGVGKITLTAAECSSISRTASLLIEVYDTVAAKSLVPVLINLHTVDYNNLDTLDFLRKMRRNKTWVKQIGGDWYEIVYDDDSLTVISQRKLFRTDGVTVPDFTGFTTPFQALKSSI